MSTSKKLLHEAIESGEEENGSVEFKSSLSKDIHLTGEKRTSLVAQLRHRVISGDGEATYAIGVSDQATIEGLSKDNFEETVTVLRELSTQADAHVSNVEKWTVENSNKLVGLVTITDGAETTDQNHLVIGTAGHVDHGKSTLVASLVTGNTDNGEGGLREYLDVQPHEVKRGLSADISYAVYGFDNKNNPQRLRNPDRSQERSEVVDKSEKLISFVDTVGHKPWLRTTIRGLVGQGVDYGLLTVAADDGPTETTREHLGVLLAMELPTIITITKADLVTESRLNQVETEIKELLQNVNATPLLETENNTNTLIENIGPRTIPVIRTSAVSMNGLDTLDELLANLPKTATDTNGNSFNMYIDKTYVVEGVGTVVSGTIGSGTLTAGDTIYIGPTNNGEYIKTKARSLEIHYHRVQKANAGQIVSVSLQNIDPEQIRRGMTITKQKPTATRTFEAEVMMLNHPTSVTNGYEPVAHLETIGETVILDPEDPPLLPGDTGKATLKFKFNPYNIQEGQRFVLREGESKGVGTVTNLNPTN